MSTRSPDHVLDQLQWLRGLAHRLVRDPHAAEDAVQDTVVAALSAEGPRPSSPRAWLGATLRHALWQRRRAEARRRRREQRVAELGERATRATVDVAAELSTYRKLLELVDELEEPYRTAITRRFLRGETPAQIARALRVPKKTVYTRIDRGLARLRRSLDDRVPGGRHAWCSAFLLSNWAADPIGSVSLFAVMKTKLLVAGVAIASLFVLFQALDGRPGSPLPVQTVFTPLVSAVDSETPPADRQTVEPARMAPPTITRETPRDWINGLVVDIDGHPVPDLEVVFERIDGSGFALDPDRVSARSGPRGEFRLPLPARRGRLRVDDASWATALHPPIGGTAPKSTIVVVAQQRSFAGHVVDEQGVPVAGARLDLDLPEAWGHKLEALGDVVALPTTLAFTHSDDDGAFEFSSVPAIGGTTLVALRDGYQPERLSMPEFSRNDLLLTLKSAIAGGLHGIVLDANDRPVPGALVSTGGDAVVSGPDGRFDVDRPYRRDGLIWALELRLGMASISFAENPQLLEGEAEVILRLSSSGQSRIRGVLRDAEGRPVSGATVWTPDTTWFGNVVSFELGTPVRGMNTIEGVMNGKPAPSRTLRTTTGADGSFELSGLTERSYALFAFAERDLATAGPMYADPGAGEVLLVLSSDDAVQISGRVLSQSGTPLPGVHIGVGRSVAWQRPAREIDPWSSAPVLPPSATLTSSEPVAITDQGGRFTTRPVQSAGAFLTFGGDPVFLARSLQLSEVGDPRRVEARADARSTFRIFVDSPGDADAFHLESDDGRKQPLFMEVEQATMSTWNMPLVDGRSGIGYSKEGEVDVVLTRDDEEVRRLRVFLPAGGVHDIHL